MAMPLPSSLGAAAAAGREGDEDVKDADTLLLKENPVNNVGIGSEVVVVFEEGAKLDRC